MADPTLQPDENTPRPSGFGRLGNAMPPPPAPAPRPQSGSAGGRIVLVLLLVATVYGVLATTFAKAKSPEQGRTNAGIAERLVQPQDMDTPPVTIISKEERKREMARLLHQTLVGEAKNVLKAAKQLGRVEGRGLAKTDGRPLEDPDMREAVKKAASRALNQAFHGEGLVPPEASFAYDTYRDALRTDGVGLVSQVRAAVVYGVREHRRTAALAAQRRQAAASRKAWDEWRASSPPRKKRRKKSEHLMRGGALPQRVYEPTTRRPAPSEPKKSDPSPSEPTTTPAPAEPSI